MLRDTSASRYVTPLREGGSLPGLVEADDLGTYVMKFTGAGQGRKSLVAEIVCGQLGRRLGLRVPEPVLLHLDPVIGRSEPDEDVQDLLRASGGLNLGIDYLPGSIGFDPLAYAVSPREAGEVVWFDALIGNVDRSWRNPNLLVWHGELWLIDHGAALTWHHNWSSGSAADRARRAYDASDHVLAPVGPDLAAAAAALAPRVTVDLLEEVLADVPDAWLVDEPGFTSPGAVRAAYVEILSLRAQGLPERVTLGPRSAPRPSQAPGWLTGRPEPAGGAAR
ncbi:HipA family kinase [Streptomyces sp. 4N509B]|uniref:HipA family kinase n=1 Tax=Streptomyces sp. 4N509B TaxID=3457413 RepID=UPI003FCF5D79